MQEQGQRTQGPFGVGENWRMPTNTILGGERRNSCFPRRLHPAWEGSSTPEMTLEDLA